MLPESNIAIAVSLPIVLFEPAVLGYGEQREEMVTVTNTGKNQVTLIQPSATEYILWHLLKTALGSGENAVFTIRPKTGLALGEHFEATINTADLSASADVSTELEVISPPLTFELETDGLTPFGAVNLAIILAAVANHDGVAIPESKTNFAIFFTTLKPLHQPAYRILNWSTY